MQPTSDENKKTRKAERKGGKKLGKRQHLPRRRRLPGICARVRQEKRGKKEGEKQQACVPIPFATDGPQ
jgi:hypothetical protein